MSKDKPFIIDGLGSMPGGMNAGLTPQLLDRTQVSMATNCTFRGGYIRNRPGLRKITLSFAEGTNQTLFETGLFQGACFFKSEYGTETIVASIGGRLFEIRPQSGGKTAVVTDVSIAGDLNSSGNSIAWLWQAERWMIINDGNSLPIFYDGAIARRSYGASHEVGEALGDFIVPAIGDSIDINLVAPYSGPYNSIVYIGNAFYQVNSSGLGYEVTLKSLSAQPGTTIASNSQLVFPNNLIGQLTADSTSSPAFNPTPPALPVPSTVALHVPPITAAIPCSAILSVHVSGATYLQGSIYICLGSVAVGTTTILLSLGSSGAGGQTVKAGAPVYNGYISGTSPLGLTTNASISAPAIGDSFNTFLKTPYTGPLPAIVVIGDELFEITASNNDPTPSNAINVTNINDTAGGTVVSGTKINTVPELPVGRMGAYGLGRNWMSLPDGRSFIGGDIVGGSSGTPALNNRDAVLHTTENSYLFGGGAFVIPGNVGDIRSMTFTANLDVSLGQGPLQVGTASSIFSCMAPVDRAVWDSITNPILTQSLIGKGPLGQYGTLLVNSDTFFRARDGIGSLVLARRDFTSWGNVPISREMQRVIDLDNPSLLENATAVQFDNRLLMGCFPYQSPLGIFQQGIIALNFDPVSSLRGKANSIYDGLWTGLQAFQFVTGQFSGDERSFAFVYESFTSRIELWELQQSGESEFDNDNAPLTWSFETGSLFTNAKGKGPFDLVRLMDGELYLSEIDGPLQIQSWFRPDSSECWTPWHSFSVCAANGPKQYRSRLGLGVPNQIVCDPTTNRPFCIGNNFQVRLQFTGACKFMGLLLKAVPEEETKFSVPICSSPCLEVVSDASCEPCREQGTCLEFPIVFYNLNANKRYSNQLLSFPIECPNGRTVTVYVEAGRINFTLPFPPDYDGEYPPLIMGCEAGGTILRSVPTGSTQAQIDAIVDEMINTCARAIAESEVNCDAPARSFSNEIVYFIHVCAEGVLTYDGTLPDWIALDADNSRLIGAAGIFNAPTQAAANALAQSALDTFGNAAVADETLTCELPGSVTVILQPSESSGWSAGENAMSFATVGGILYGMGNINFYTSLDGATWSLIGAHGMSSVTAMTHGAGVFVATSNNITPRFYSSVDGITWVQRTSGQIATHIAFGNGIFVAAGNSNNASVSSDGVSWVSQAALGFTSVRGLAFGNGIFVAAGQSGGFGIIQSSTDGVVWTTRFLGGPASMWSVGFSGGLFVVVGTSGNVLTSPDGINWTVQTFPTSDDLVACGGGGGGGTYLAVSGFFPTGDVYISTDSGVTWNYLRTEASDKFPYSQGIQYYPNANVINVGFQA